MKFHPLLLAAAALAIPSTRAATQSVPPIVTNWVGGAFQAAVCGDFRGSLRQSVVVLRDNQLHFVFSPIRYGHHTSISNGPSNVTGIAAIPHPSSAVGRRDSLLVTTTTAVLVGTFDPASNSFVFTTLPQLAAWSGAHAFVVRQDPAADVVWVAARSADQSTLLMGKRDAEGNLVSVGSAPLVASVHGIDVLDWDNDGEREFVAICPAGVRTFKTTGEFEQMTSTQVYHGASVRTLRAGSHELATASSAFWPGGLAVLFGKNGSQTQLLPIPANGLSLLDQQPTGLRSFDLDNDGSGELLLSQYGSHQVRIIRPSTGSVTSLAVHPAPQGNARLNLCPPLWRDLDGDGFVDLLAFLTSMNCMSAVPRAIGGQHAHILPLGGQQNLQPELVLPSTYDGHQLHLELSPAFTRSANELQITVWHQDTPSSHPTLDPIGAKLPPLAIQPWPGAYAESYHVQVPMQPLVIGQANTWPLADHYYLDIRFIDTIANTVVHAEIVGVTVRTSPQVDTLAELTSELGYLTGLEDAPGQMKGTVFITAAPASGLLPGGFPIGGIITRIIPPDFSDTMPDERN